VNVTALASHGSLGNLLTSSSSGRDGSLEVTAFLAIVAGVAEGLEALHSNGIVHCDVKADNVVINMTEEGDPLLWLIDFGDARLVDDATSWYGQGPGAPEIACWPDVEAGQYSSHTDSWCLAQFAAGLWTGSVHNLDNPAWLHQDMPLKHEFQQCLAWNPSCRLQAADIARAAHAALEARHMDAKAALKQLVNSIP